MSSKKLISLVNEKHGSLMSFASVANINYNTLYYSTRSDDRLDKMPISNFIIIAHALGMTADELAEELDV